MNEVSDSSVKLGVFSIGEVDGCGSDCGDDDLDGPLGNIFGYDRMECCNCQADDIGASNVDKHI